MAHSRALARILFLDRQSKVHIAGTDSVIEIVARYKHLGILSAANASLALELLERETARRSHEADQDGAA